MGRVLVHDRDTFGRLEQEIRGEDLQDGADYGGVSVRNPFTLAVADERSAYTALPKLASRHRGRGRPRRNPPRAASV